jgi:curved DNA-binding protein CbpA
MNPYEILGVKPGASLIEIKTAYKRLVKEYHPDISKKSNALEMMKKINRAYDILTKPQLARRPIQYQPQRVVIFYGYDYNSYYSETNTNSWG